jgi:hypothetical protein
MSPDNAQSAAQVGGPAISRCCTASVTAIRAAAADGTVAPAACAANTACAASVA